MEDIKTEELSAMTLDDGCEEGDAEMEPGGGVTEATEEVEVVSLAPTAAHVEYMFIPVEVMAILFGMSDAAPHPPKAFNSAPSETSTSTPTEASPPHEALASPPSRLKVSVGASRASPALRPLPFT